MPEAQAITTLKIGRHPAQQLLLEALKLSPKQSSGSFTVDGDEITAIAPLGTPLPSGARGIYYSAFANGEQIDSDLLARVQQQLGLDDIRYCLVVALDTEGRMEALTFVHEGGIYTPIPLELEEDRDLYPLPANR